MELEKLEIYQMSLAISQKIWDIVKTWPYFERDTIGKQLVRAADSISANISEGYGRFHFRDSKNFLYYSRGSLFETKSWLAKAKDRQLISPEEFLELDQKIIKLSVKLNNFIKSIGQKNKFIDQTNEKSYDNI